LATPGSDTGRKRRRDASIHALHLAFREELSNVVA
jgi:hypothetical protein